MRNFLCQVIFSLLAFASFAQDASYSFEGQLTNDQQSAIQARISALPGVVLAKLRYKNDAERGEILLFLEERKEDERNEANATLFSPVDVKLIFTDFQLSSLEYTTFKR